MAMRPPVSSAPCTIIELVSPLELRIFDTKLLGGDGMPDLHSSLGKNGNYGSRGSNFLFSFIFLHLKLYSYLHNAQETTQLSTMIRFLCKSTGSNEPASVGPTVLDRLAFRLALHQEFLHLSLPECLFPITWTSSVEGNSFLKGLNQNVAFEKAALTCRACPRTKWAWTPTYGLPGFPPRQQ